MNCTLKRYGSIPGVGTPGVLYIAGQEYPTIEREWLNNKPFVSCIPTGRYRLVPYSSRKYPKAYALVNEAKGVYVNHSDLTSDQGERYAILIHSANLASQLSGCIAPGIEAGCVTIRGQTSLGVLKSRTASKAIYNLLDDTKEPIFIDIEQVEVDW